MPTVPQGFVHQRELGKKVEDSVAKLSTLEVVRVRHSIGVDSTGEASIFFRIVLSDAASKADKLAEVTSRIAGTLFEELRPQESWGLLPYFSFRSKAEQDSRNEPEWAQAVAYHDDLLNQAFMLVHKEPRKPSQASLRPAVSSAYYALSIF